MELHKFGLRCAIRIGCKWIILTGILTLKEVGCILGNNKFKIKDGLYKNRIGEIRSVKRDDFLKDYPFRDNRLTAYNENGKLYKNRESDFDLVQEC